MEPIKNGVRFNFFDKFTILLGLVFYNCVEFKILTFCFVFFEIEIIYGLTNEQRN